MSKKVQYLKIRTIADLRAERQRVDAELGRVGSKLRGDYENVTHMFSMGYVVEQITGRAGQVYNLVQWAMSGYEFVRSLIDKYKNMAAEKKAEK